MKVLVTGSAGQLGSFVCELMAGPHDVAGLDLRPSPYPGVKEVTVEGDIRRPADVRRVLKGVDCVVHCAAQVSVVKSFEDPLSDAETNVLGTVNLLHESLKAGVSRFVYISSAAVFGDPAYVPIDEKHLTEPMSNYGSSKLAGERFALAYAASTPLQAVVVRPFNFYSMRADPKSPYSGVITKFVERVSAGKPPVIDGDGLQTRDFIHARDVARMVSMLAERKDLSGEVFNCGSGTSTSILDLARLVVSVSGKGLEPEFGPPRQGDIRHSCADMKKVRSLTGFEARTSLRDGLSELLG